MMTPLQWPSPPDINPLDPCLRLGRTGFALVKINGEPHYLWRAVDHGGEVLGFFVTKTRDTASAVKFLKKAMKRYGGPEEVVTDRLRLDRAAMNEIGNGARQVASPHENNRARPVPPAVPKTGPGDGVGGLAIDG